MAWAFAVSNHQMDAARMVRDDWDDVLQIRPLESMAREAIGEDIHFLNTWFEHPDNDELWQMSDWQARSKGARIPALIFSGWFDDDGMGTTQALELVHDWPAAQRKAVLGPWIHSFNSRYDIHGVPMGLRAHPLRRGPAVLPVGGPFPAGCGKRCGERSARGILHHRRRQVENR